MATESNAALETFSQEDRRFPPPPAFTAKANVKDPGIYERAAKDLEGFWAEQAKTLTWRKPFTKVLEWEAPYAKWFIGGELNISENCLDRHVKAGKGSQVAYYWEGEPGDSRKLTFKDLLDLTCRAANALKELGVRKGDRVAIYMPMIPELPAAMLACARIGAPFTVVFGGFSAEALSGRINDSEAKVLITADGGYRKGGIVPLKKNADDAIAQTKGIEKVLVVRRTKQEVPWSEGRDVWWHDIVDRQKPECPAESLESEHMLYLLYTSGTTAKPKGIVHTTAGYLAGVATTHKLIFDVKDADVYWCAADIGWVTGHSYIVFAPLANGTTGVMYEGTPDFPDKDGKSVPAGGAGYLVISRPWPAMLRGIYKDDKRYRETYWARYPGKYFAGDGARRDKDGYLWLMGRVDDVMKVSGHRISTTEVESALVSHPKVAEAAVIGREDPITGQAIFAFVTLRGGHEGSEELSKELREHVVKAIGSIARPKTIMFTPELPKTRSGKIMRRLLRDIANGVPLGDTTTLADSTVVESIRTASATGKDD